MARRQYGEVHRQVSTKGPRFMMLGGFAVGLGGVSWFQKRKKEAEPYRARDAQLLVAFKETRRAQREQCRGVPRR